MNTSNILRVIAQTKDGKCAANYVVTPLHRRRILETYGAVVNSQNIGEVQVINPRR